VTTGRAGREEGVGGVRGGGEEKRDERRVRWRKKKRDREGSREYRGGEERRKR